MALLQILAKRHVGESEHVFAGFLATQPVVGTARVFRACVYISDE